MTKGSIALDGMRGDFISAAVAEIEARVDKRVDLHEDDAATQGSSDVSPESPEYSPGFPQEPPSISPPKVISMTEAAEAILRQSSPAVGSVTSASSELEEGTGGTCGKDSPRSDAESTVAAVAEPTVAAVAEPSSPRASSSERAQKKARKRTEDSSASDRDGVRDSGRSGGRDSASSR